MKMAGAFMILWSFLRYFQSFSKHPEKLCSRDEKLSKKVCFVNLKMNLFIFLTEGKGIEPVKPIYGHVTKMNLAFDDG